MNLKDRQERTWICQSQNDPKAFRHLFDRYFNPIFNYILRRTCNSTITEDITANTFMKALDKIDQFQWKGISFSSWLYRIATNEIHQHYRKTKRILSLSPAKMSNFRGDCSSDAGLLNAEEALAKNRQFQRVHTTIAKLKSKYQTVITLRYFENLSIKEIAYILDISENTVKTQIRRGLIQLKKEL